MANIQQINGDYYGSKETLTEALPYVKKKDVYSAAINNFFGIADKELSNYEDAIYYYNEGLKDCSDSLCKQSILNNIAVVYIKQKKYDKAIKIFESILNIKGSGDQFINSKAGILDNYGYALFKKGLNEKGFLFMKQSLDLRQSNVKDYGSIENNLHLSEFHFKSQPQKSKQFASNAYETATKIHSIDERLKALSFLMTNNSVTNKTEYIQKFIFLNDSILKVRNNFKNKFAKIKYDSKKEKDENEKLRLEKAVAQKDSENEKIVFIGILIILLFLFAYLKKHYDNRNRIGKIKTVYDTETRISKDIHDELANDVFDTITFTQTQSLTTENNTGILLQKLNHIYTRVRGISRENNDIDTGINYSRNLKEMLSTYSDNNINVSINGIEKINWDVIEELKKITIHRVLQELMVNMKKHSEASVVVLKFETDSNKIFLNYSDNGKGSEKSKIIKNGLQNMENRILSVKGAITFETEPQKGFKVKITMPK
ncbi:ATP-binding protein [Flavobacterium sp. LHD-80]|uniref:tetratricopeptide repeat-containing sensor histidine kinase n=1 Tax=Flavobacterium sp. LHD-80 TaxID=3071411 RepID=UPI0027DEB4D1|nr:ATP-binding protein [Flavobacterium sp. LHD-80]MDQ6470867.1 ATP-binding protein [Flavobacterium sp. LHD-80]